MHACDLIYKCTDSFGMSNLWYINAEQNIFIFKHVFVQIATRSFNPQLYRLKLKGISLWLFRFMHNIYAVHE